MRADPTGGMVIELTMRGKFLAKPNSHILHLADVARDAATGICEIQTFDAFPSGRAE